MAHKTLADLARAAGRKYTTPEDVGRNIRSGRPIRAVRLELLEILGRVHPDELGAEDSGLCAFVALNRRKRRR